MVKRDTRTGIGYLLPIMLLAVGTQCLLPPSRRVLTAYTPSTDPDVKEFCTDKNIDFESLTLPEPKRVELRKDIEGIYSTPSASFVDIIAEGGFNAQNSAKINKVVVNLPIVIISIIFLIIIALLCLYGCVRALIACIRKRRNPPALNKDLYPIGHTEHNPIHAHVDSDDEEDQRIRQKRDEEDRIDRERDEHEENNDKELSEEKRQKKQQNREEKQKKKQQKREEEDQKRKQKKEEKRNKKDNKKEEKKDNNDELENAKKKQNAFKWASAGLGVSALTVTIIWIVYLAKAVNNVKKTNCAAAGLKSFTVKGDMSNPDARFPGTEGISFVGKQYSNLLRDLATTNTVAVPATSLGTAMANAGGVKTSFAAIPSVTTSYEYLGLDGTAKIASPGIKDYVLNLIPNKVRAEANLLGSACDNLIIAGDFYDGPITVQMADNIDANVESIVGKVKVSLVDPITSIYGKLFSTPPKIMTQVKTVGMVALILGGILIFLALVILCFVLAVIGRIMRAVNSARGKAYAAAGVDDEEERRRRENAHHHDDHRHGEHPAQEDSHIAHQNKGDDPAKTPDNMAEDERKKINKSKGSKDSHHNHDNEEDDHHRKNKDSHHDHKDKRDSHHDNDDHKHRDDENNDNRKKNIENKKDEMKNDASNKAKGCCKKLMSLKVMKILQLVVSLVLIVVSILLFIYAIASVAGGIVVATGCKLIDGTLTQKGFYERTLGKGGYFAPELGAVVRECIEPEGSGNLGTAINSQITSELSSATSGVYGLVQFADIKASAIYSATNPPEGKSTSDRVTKLDNMDEKDSDDNSNDLNSGINSVNNNKCTQDTMAYNGKCVAGSQQSQISPEDTNTASLDSSYCIMMTQVPSHAYAGRYDGKPTTGYCATVDTSAGQAKLTAASKSAIDYKSKISSLKSTYDTFYTAENNCFNALKDNTVATSVDSMSKDANLAKVIELQRQFKGGAESLLTCTFARRSLIAVENVLCFQTFKYIYNQTGLAFANAIIMLFLSLSVLGSCWFTHKVESLTQ
jgi:Ca2+/Na+ antiporter